MATPTYRQNKEKLEKILLELQNPATDLDKALELHKEAKDLIGKLEKYLEIVDEKIKKVS